MTNSVTDKDAGWKINLNAPDWRGEKNLGDAKEDIKDAAEDLKDNIRRDDSLDRK